MGFYINEEIETKLHYKDISLIAAAFGAYQERFNDTADKEVLDRMRDLVNRLGIEMYNNPKNEEPNGH
jgi:predicted SpoU family rRNA methylase